MIDLSYMLIGLGGMFRSITRYVLGNWIANRCRSCNVLKTSIINISGAFFLGLLMTIDIHENLYLLLAEGYLGAYTTFSTFMYEGFNLFNNNKKINAMTYVLGTLFLGLVGFALGANICN